MPRKKRQAGRTRANGLGEKTVLPSGRIRWRIRDAARRTLASGTVDTDRQANDAIAAAMTAIARGTLVQKSSITLREYAGTWLERQTGLEENTRLDYGYNLGYALEIIGDQTLQSITRETVKSLMHALSKKIMTRGSGTGRVMSARTLGEILTRLRVVFREALEDDIITRDPAGTVKPVKALRTEHPGIALSFDQADRLVAIGRMLYAAGCLRLWPAILACISVGLRRGEVMGLTWAHIDLEGGTISIRQQLVSTGGPVSIKPHAKTDAGNRDIPIPPSLVAALTVHKAQQKTERLECGLSWTASTPVFPTVEGIHTHPDNLSRSVHNLVEWSTPGPITRKTKNDRGEVLERLVPLERRLLAIPTDYRPALETLIKSGVALPAVSPHDLRHTAGSHMLMRGMDLEAVSDMLGHRDSSITRQVYIHITAAFRRENLIDLFPLD